MLWANYALASHQELRQFSYLQSFYSDEDQPCLRFALNYPRHLHKRLFDRIKYHRIGYFSFHSLSILNSNTALFQALRKNGQPMMQSD